MACILIVEDESIVAKDIKHKLKKLGYTVLAVVSSGKDAVEKAQENPDLVLMDIVLKGDTDGIKAAETIHTQFDIPVVYLTAHADDRTLQRAKITEPYGYILKPFEGRELYSAIEMALYKHKMEKRVRESEQWLSTILKSIGDAVIAIDTTKVVTFMNPVAEALTGWSQKEAAGKNLDDIFTIVDEKTGEKVESPAEQVLRGEAGGAENGILLRDGTDIHVDEGAAPIKDDKGTITGVVVTFRDISKRKLTERALKRTEEMYKARKQELAERKQREEALREKQTQLDNLLTNVNAIVLEGDASRITFVAGQVEQLLGYSREQWFSHPEGALGFWKDHVHPDDYSTVVPYRVETVREGRNRTLEYRMIAADGREVWFCDNATVDVQKDTVQVRSVMVDITERKKAEEELMQLSTAVKMSSDSIVVTDITGYITDANEAAVRMWRAHKKEEFIGRFFIDSVVPEDRKKVNASFEDVLQKGYAENLEYTLIAGDGLRITVETNMALMKNAEELPLGVVSISRDITERKKAEKEMKKKLMKYDLEEGNMYIVKEDVPCVSVEAFQDLLTVGYPGLAISRTPKGEFKGRFRQEFNHVWVAEKGDGHLLPEGEEILGEIERLTSPTAIFIDRLDYLLSKTGFTQILSLVQSLREIAYLKNQIIILSVDPATMDPRELRQIEKEAAAIEPLYKTKLSEELFEVLKVVYEQDIKGVSPSYVEVGQAIGASKPTTRKRIRTLIGYRYLEESKKGRSKTVTLTEKGRSLFLR
jgi:PAS domain S-box-containing protein